MTKLEKLKSTAMDTAQDLGHSMQNWLDLVDCGITSFNQCVICNQHVMVCASPAPDEKEIGGPAMWVPCYGVPIKPLDPEDLAAERFADRITRAVVPKNLRETAAPYYPSFKVYSRRSEDDYKLIGIFVAAAAAILRAEDAFNTNLVESVYVTREETIYDHAKPPFREIRETASDIYQPLLIDSADHKPTGRKAQRRSVDRTMAKIRKLHEDLNAALYTHPTERPKIQSPQDAVQILTYFLTGLDHEEFWILNLDTRNRIAHCVKLYVATVNKSDVRVSEVFRQAIIDNSPAIIIGHNHPSGNPTPSPDDISVTRTIVQAGALLDIDVLDHIIIGEHGNFVSLKERGLGFDT